MLTDSVLVGFNLSVSSICTEAAPLKINIFADEILGVPVPVGIFNRSKDPVEAKISPP